MYSVLFQIGSISIFSYGLITALGFLLGIIYFIRLSMKNKSHLEFVSDHFFLFLISALIGARLAYAYAFWEVYSWNPWSLLYFWEDAYLVWGGIIGLLAVFYIACAKQKEKINDWIDTIIPALTLGLLFHHIAQFLDGSAYGTPTELFWGVTFETTSVPYTIPIHPVQLYLASLMLVALIFIYPLLKRNQSEKGKVGWGGLIFLSLSNFLVEFWRGDDMSVLLGLRWTQVMELGVLAFGILMYYRLLLKEKSIDDHDHAQSS